MIQETDILETLWELLLMKKEQRFKKIEKKNNTAICFYRCQKKLAIIVFPTLNFQSICVPYSLYWLFIKKWERNGISLGYVKAHLAYICILCQGATQTFTIKGVLMKVNLKKKNAKQTIMIRISFIKVCCSQIV